MSTNSITPTSSSGSYAEQSSSTRSASYDQMDATSFMQLLMAQLTHQDPLQPMSDSDMMSQFAQLNSLSELQSISSVLNQSTAINQTSYAASLIGKTVKIAAADASTVEGVVSAITTEAGVLSLRIDDQTYPLSEVVEIIGGKE